jgi:hypothetical protein
VTLAAPSDQASACDQRLPEPRRNAGRNIAGVFERFTDRARRVMVLAQEEARRRSHGEISSEHLLLAVVHDGDGGAVEMLAKLGISPDAVRAQVSAGLPADGAAPADGAPPFAASAKKVLEGALRETLRLDGHEIGPEHLLVGVARQTDTAAARALASLGADLDTLRHQLALRRQQESVAAVPPEQAGTAPRCPGCRSSLVDHAKYVTASIDPIEPEPPRPAMTVRFVFCEVCGHTINADTVLPIGGLSGLGVHAPPEEGS